MNPNQNAQEKKVPKREMIGMTAAFTLLCTCLLQLPKYVQSPKYLWQFCRSLLGTYLVQLPKVHLRRKQATINASINQYVFD